MEIVRQDDGDEFDIGLLEHVAQVGVGPNAGKLPSRGLKAFLLHVAHGAWREPLRLHGIKVILAHVEGGTVADHADINTSFLLSGHFNDSL